MDASYFWPDLLEFAGLFTLTIGAVILTRTFTFFSQKNYKKPAFMTGAGIVLIALLHEFSELMFKIDVHGGIPKTLYGSLHIIILNSLGGVIFLIGAFTLYRNYLKFLKK